MRTITDREVELKAHLTSLITSGSDPNEIVAAAEAVAKQILDSAEAEAELMRPNRSMSEEQKQHLREVWTPEKRAAHAEKLKGRVLTDEQRMRLSNSLKERKAQQEQEHNTLLNRIKELEALLTPSSEPVAVEDVPNGGNVKRGRRG